jgi:hypothetical protein
VGLTAFLFRETNVVFRGSIVHQAEEDKQNQTTRPGPLTTTPFADIHATEPLQPNKLTPQLLA